MTIEPPIPFVLPENDLIPEVETRLVVFSDDWGRHPSSCQHLVRELVPGYEVTWVNTVGTRRPGINAADLKRAAGKLVSWAGRSSRRATAQLPAGLSVINPIMWPGFRQSWQRRLNARFLSRAVNEALGHRRDERRVAVTTLPITADLIGRLDVDRWVYYCVDDFSAWPGLDSDVMQSMERELVRRVDAVVAVSSTLQQRIATMGRRSTLLTHGINPAHWRSATSGHAAPTRIPHLSGPVALFWGLIDRRLDTMWCVELAEALRKQGGALVLAGPCQSHDPVLSANPGIELVGPVAYEHLPAWASRADVLVMPYTDTPVTRAMQPLKFKEYLATGKPVVARRLPATEAWHYAADLADDVDGFVSLVLGRWRHGLTPGQRYARLRLEHETWTNKAKEFSLILQMKGEPIDSARSLREAA
ncbi:MAG: glycosyltransferase family 1 protein [Phycisphaeraceae bacterium]